MGIGALVLAFLACLVIFVDESRAITALPAPPPAPGSYGIEATKPQPPPEVGASITTPGNGAGFTNSPITVNGICPSGLLVEIFDNGVMVGSTMCKNGSFSVQISLFNGKNELTAEVFDDLGQQGPTSNKVTVTYNNSRLTAFGQLLTLTSQYGRRSAPVHTKLVYPLQLTGGTGPYAFSIDWGDGTKPELKSQATAGGLDISHTYDNAGIYVVSITVTDSNGVTAFLQVIAVASGKVSQAAASAGDKSSTTYTNGKPQMLLWPTIILLILLLPTYWLGRRSMLISIHNKLLRDRDAYEAEQKKHS